MLYNDKVSVLMAEYNTNPEFLIESIKSILSQTYQNFELIIVDDCGKNDLDSICATFKDDRIIVIHNEKNMGLAQSLNKGLEYSNCEYIIRMDTDDICLPNRFEKQIQFVIKNSQYDIVGGKHIIFDNSKEYKTKCKVSGEIKNSDFLYNTPFSHPTLILKRESIIKVGGYPNYRRGQDYAMEMNAFVHGCKGYVMDEFLVKYRQDADAYKKKNYKSRILEYKIRRAYFKKLNLPLIRIIYEIKPLIVGLIPNFLLKRFHERG